MRVPCLPMKSARSVRLAVAGLLLAGVGVSVPAAAGAGGTVRLTADVLPGLSSYRDLGLAPADMRMTVVVGVHRDLAALYAAEAKLYDPTSASYHHFLTPAEFHLRFGTPPAQLARIRAFATGGGLELSAPDLYYDYVQVSGTVAQVERTFDVSIHRFADKSGGSFFANTDAPAVPAGLGIEGVFGLENRLRFGFDTAKPTAVPMSYEQSCAPEPGSATGQACTASYDPQDLWGAYEQPGDNFGDGQSVAIMGGGQTQDVIAALRRFEQLHNLPFVPVQVFHTEPGAEDEAALDDSGKGEWELDTQASSGMAPHLAQLRLYFANSTTVSGLTSDLVAWANDPNGPLTANASLGIQEDNLLIKAIVQQDYFATAQAAMEGRTLFASTGDVATGCAYPLPGLNGVTNGAPADCYPSVDPNAVGVGGTTLYTDGASTNPQRVFEKVWDHTGGGPSHYVKQPAYQTGASPFLQSNVCATDGDGTPYAPGTVCRGVSDVSALSGDMTLVFDGLSVQGHDAPVNAYDQTDATCSFDSSGNQSCTYADHYADGGTSLSSPLWAGMWARVLAHHSVGNDPGQSLGFANPIIYKLGKNSTTDARDFYDVVAGSNGYPATPGWDFPSGWGTPNVTNLIKDATGTSTTAPVSPGASTATTDPAPIFVETAPPPDCSYIMRDQSPDTSDLLGADIPQLDITQFDMALSSDKTKLRVVFTLRDLSKQIPLGWTTNQYQAWWTFGGTTYAVDAEVNAAGLVSYGDGTFQVINAPVVGGQYQYVASPTSTATGSFAEGPGGKVEVDVPLSDIGSPTPGQVLAQPFAATAEVDGASSASQGFLVDLDGPGSDYSLGAASCADLPQTDVPEAPTAALLLGVGAAGAAAVTLAHRRRRLS